MGYDLNAELLFTAGTCAIVALAIALQRLQLGLACFLVTVRFALPVAYFAWYFDGTWMLLDDFAYTKQGEYLIDQGYTPLMIFSGEGISELQALAGGRHILYVWWNLLAMWLFGVHYYAAVFMNVAVTFATGFALHQLLRSLKFQERYICYFHVLFLLHWETFAWSGFVNMKDSIVQFLTVLLCLFCARCAAHRHARDAIGFVATALLLQWIRFYTPYIFTMAIGAWLFVQWRDPLKYLIATGAAGVAWFVLPWHHFIDAFDPAALLFGSLRYLLTPQPWGVDETYGFLTIPAALHWLFFLPAVLAGLLLWKESPRARVILLHAGGLCLFYASIDYLQGVRQRAQIGFLFAWLHFHLIWHWWNGSPIETPVPCRGKGQLPKRPAPVRSVQQGRQPCG